MQGVSIRCSPSSGVNGSEVADLEGGASVDLDVAAVVECFLNAPDYLKRCGQILCRCGTIRNSAESDSSVWRGLGAPEGTVVSCPGLPTIAGMDWPRTCSISHRRGGLYVHIANGFPLVLAKPKATRLWCVCWRQALYTVIAVDESECCRCCALDCHINVLGRKLIGRNGGRFQVVN